MARPSFWRFFVDQRQGAPPLETTDLSGKTVLVTGASSRVGLDAAKHFASMKPARLILACRNVARGKEVAEEIKNETGFADAEAKPLDQADFASVRAFTDDLEAEGRPIDILVANIGVSLQKYHATNDGWEETCVNPYSPHSEGSRPRIVVVASSMHYWANPLKSGVDGAGILKSWNDKANPKSGVFEVNDWYSKSKLLNIFFTRELGERMPDDIPIEVVSVFPGYCASGLRRELWFPINYLDYAMEKLFAYTSEEGSRQLIWAAIGGIGKAKELQGAFITHSDITEPSDSVLGEEGNRVQKQIWMETMDILSGISPKVLSVTKTLKEI